MRGRHKARSSTDEVDGCTGEAAHPWLLRAWLQRDRPRAPMASEIPVLRFPRLALSSLPVDYRCQGQLSQLLWSPHPGRVPDGQSKGRVRGEPRVQAALLAEGCHGVEGCHGGVPRTHLLTCQLRREVAVSSSSSRPSVSGSPPSKHRPLPSHFLTEFGCSPSRLAAS